MNAPPNARSAEDEEEELQRPLEWSLIRRLFGYAAPVRRKLAALIVLTVIRAAQLPALVWLISLVITGPVAGGDVSGLVLGVAGYALLALSTDGLFHFRQRYALEIGEAVVNRLRADLFARTQRQPLSFFQRVKLGRIIGRVTSDVEALRVGIQDVLFVSAIQAGQMLFAAVVMAWSDPLLFLVVLGLAPILWLVNRRFRVRLSRHSRAASDSFSRVTASLAEAVNGMRVTQGFVREDTNAGLFRQLLADHSRHSVALARTSAILTPLLELNSQFFVAVLLLFGGARVFTGAMNVGDLVTFFLLANQFFAPIAVIGNQYNQALVAMAGAERVFRLLDTRPDWEDPPGALALPDPRGSPGAPAGLRLEFAGVDFAYVPGRPVLHQVSFTAEPGMMVALVGHTGSGKSSIVGLAAKFHLPTAGVVRIDGHDLRTLAGGPLHRQMGIVPQESFLFSGSVLDNIRSVQPDAGPAEVRAAAARLGCLDLLEALPQGLATEVGERGARLSSGQRQLVCFTRALLADPRLVILDEATSAVDAETEVRLQRALGELLRGRTSLVVAHRLSTIRHADLVLVLDEGRVLERGTHAGLLARGGAYAALHRRFIAVDEPVADAVSPREERRFS